MGTSVVVLRETEVRMLLDPASCVAAVEQAFSAYAAGAAELPGVIHLDVPEAAGEVHIKAGYLHGGPGYAVKVASGFPGNTSHGLPANDGLVMVFDAKTGGLAALLLDGGYITDLRTAAAGAVAVKHLGRDSIETVAVVGTGVQARLQVELLATVRAFRSVRVWGRRREAAERCAADLSATGSLTPGASVVAVDTPEAAVRGADLVYTVTASRQPLVRAEWVGAGTLVVAVGSDGADKQELEVDVLASADRVVADSLPQCLRLGEIHHAVAAGVLQASHVTELGQVAAGTVPGRQTPAERIVCDLTGIGVQDVAAATVVLQRALERRVGERLIASACLPKP